MQELQHLLVRLLIVYVLEHLLQQRDSDIRGRDEVPSSRGLLLIRACQNIDEHDPDRSEEIKSSQMRERVVNPNHQRFDQRSYTNQLTGTHKKHSTWLHLQSPLELRDHALLAASTAAIVVRLSLPYFHRISPRLLLQTTQLEGDCTRYFKQVEQMREPLKMFVLRQTNQTLSSPRDQLEGGGGQSTK